MRFCGKKRPPRSWVEDASSELLLIINSVHSVIVICIHKFKCFVINELPQAFNGPPAS